MAVHIPLMACEDPARTCDHARPSPPPSPPPPPYSLCNAFSPKASLPRRLFDVAPRNLSKGDFLSVVRLLRELVDTFEECGRTSQEQIGLIAEIRKLEEAIIQVEAHYGTIESPAQQMVLEHAAQACQKSIYDFVTDARQCRRNVDPYCTEHTGRDDLTDMRLDLVTDKDMNAFRRCISDHVQSIQTLLITIQVSSTELACGHEDIRPSTSPQAGQMSGTNYSLVLLNNSFATLRQALVDQGSVSQNTLANVDAIREIMVMNNLQLLSALEQLQKSIPAQVLLKEPVIFTDALDRVAPIHLDWITSWDAFLAVLEVRFSHLGSSKIKRREFALQESATRSELAFTTPIDLCLKPGQHVDMSMIFQDRKGEITKNVCPHCHTVCAGSTDTETICVLCGCQFRRVEEQDDRSEAICDAMSIEKIVGQTARGTSRKRKRFMESMPSDEVGPRDFKKVRLMCARRLKHTRRTGNRSGLEEFDAESDCDITPFDAELMQKHNFVQGKSSTYLAGSSLTASSSDYESPDYNRQYYNCKYCTFKTRRETNCKEHMKKKHGRTHERVRFRGKVVRTPGQAPPTPSMEYSPSPEPSTSTNVGETGPTSPSDAYNGSGPESTRLNSTPGLPGEQPLSVQYLNRSAQQYDNSVLSKISTVQDKAYPHDLEYSVYDPRYIQLSGGPSTASPHPNIGGFWSPSDLSDVQHGSGTGEYGRGMSTSVSGAYQTPPYKARTSKRKRRMTNDIATDNFYERWMVTLTPQQSPLRLSNTGHFEAPPPLPPPKIVNDSGETIDTADLISPNWCGGVVDDTPPNFSLSDDLYGGSLDKLFNGDPSGSTMSPPMLSFEEEMDVD